MPIFSGANSNEGTGFVPQIISKKEVQDFFACQGTLGADCPFAQQPYPTQEALALYPPGEGNNHQLMADVLKGLFIGCPQHKELSQKR